LLCFIIQNFYDRNHRRYLHDMAIDGYGRVMTNDLSKVQRLHVSPAAAFRRKVREARDQGRDIIDLTAGDLDFPTPPHVVEAAVAAARRGDTRYTDVDGTPELKDAVRAHFRRQNGLTYQPAEIVVTNGSSQAIANSFIASLRAGDEVVIPSPGWQTYAGQTALAGGTPIAAPCYQNNRFKLAPDDLAAAITERTRWVVINNPVNPTGALYSHSELAGLCQVLQQHPQVWVLADNLYEHNVFDGQTSVTPLQVDPRLRDRTVTIGGVAKSYSMTGWRIGWAAGPRAFIADMTRIQQLTTSCASSISQAAAVAALTGPQEVVKEYAAALQAKRDRLVRHINGSAGLSCTPPEATFYLCVACAGALGRRTPGGHLIKSGEDLSAYLLEAAGVACLPGEAYALPAYVRMSFAVPAELLDRAGASIQQACGMLQ
jgi:aspartate aminotransferase